MIGLSLRLALSGGRETALRLFITVAGVGLGVALILLSLSLEPALERRMWRSAQRAEFIDSPEVAARATGHELLIAVTHDRYRDHEITLVHLARRGDNAPVPPGLQRLPRVGEVFASPALADLLSRSGGSGLAARLGGDWARLGVGDDALIFREELVAWLGVEPRLLDNARARSVSSFPLPAPAVSLLGSKLPLRLGAALGAVGLLVPIFIFVGVMTRLGAAVRERRLAVLRLLGATPPQARLLATGEAAVVSVLGTSLGVALFFALRPLAAKVPLAGAAWLPTDFAPPAAAFAVVFLLVSAMSVIGTLISLRRLEISPLGVVRRGRAKDPSPVRFGFLVVGGTGLLIAAVWGSFLDPGSLIVVGAVSLGLVTIGLPVLGPWACSKAAALLTSRSRAVLLLAGRRLKADPSSAFRASSGVMLGVFVATLFYGYASGNLGELPTADLPGATDVRVDATGLDPTTVSETAARLPEADGVIDHVLIRRGFVRGTPVAVASCRKLERFRLAVAEPCPGSEVFLPPGTRLPRSGASEIRLSSSLHLEEDSVTDLHGIDEVGTIRPLDVDVVGGPVIQTGVVPEEVRESLPISELLIETDGSRQAVENVRNVLVPQMPGVEIVTLETIRAKFRQPIAEVERAIDVAVAIILLVAVASLASATTASILERRRPFTLLRMTGVPLRSICGMAAVEAALPLTLSVCLSAALGIVSGAAFVTAVGGSYNLPVKTVTLLVVTGIAAGLLMIASLFPILSRWTDPRSLRTE